MLVFRNGKSFYKQVWGQAGSIPDDVTGNLHWNNPSGDSVALG